MNLRLDFRVFVNSKRVHDTNMCMRCGNHRIRIGRRGRGEHEEVPKTEGSETGSGKPGSAGESSFQAAEAISFCAAPVGNSHRQRQCGACSELRVSWTSGASTAVTSGRAFVPVSCGQCGVGN